MSQSHTARNWREASEIVHQIAGELPIFWGTGNPVYKPHVVATTMDAWSGEGFGYTVMVRPEGDGYMRKFTLHRICIHNTKEQTNG